MNDQAYHVPSAVVELTLHHLREKGRMGTEGVVLWVGTFEPPQVTSAIVPAQRTSFGRFSVPLSERQRITRTLAGSGAAIVAQVHSHPGAAFHSAVDDAEAIPRRQGSLSLVIPDFAARPTLLDGAELFELHEDGSWRPAAIHKLVLDCSSDRRPSTIRRFSRWLTANLNSFGHSLI